MDPISADRRAVPVVPRARNLPERAGLVLSLRLEQDGYGLSRNELVPAARRAAYPRAPEPLRRDVGEGAGHGLDVYAPGAVSGRRGRRDHRAAARTPTRLRTAPRE